MEIKREQHLKNIEIFDIRKLIGEATEYDKKQALEVKKPKSWWSERWSEELWNSEKGYDVPILGENAEIGI